MAIHSVPSGAVVIWRGWPAPRSMELSVYCTIVCVAGSRRPNLRLRKFVNQIPPSGATVTSVRPVPVKEPEQGEPLLSHGEIRYSS